MDLQIAGNTIAPWRMRVRFAGAMFPREYVSLDVRSHDPGWASESFRRPITRLEFFLPTGHRLVLSGMERYCFFVEASQGLGDRGWPARIEAFWFCGKLPGLDLVEMWRISNGQVLRQRRLSGREWGGGPIRGWKSGRLGAKAVSALIK